MRLLGVKTMKQRRTIQRRAQHQYYCIFDDSAVWSIGRSCQEAHRDLESAVESPVEVGYEPSMWQIEESRGGDMWCLPCSKQLYDYVDRYGGDVSFDVIDGVVELFEEALRRPQRFMEGRSRRTAVDTLRQNALVLLGIDNLSEPALGAWFADHIDPHRTVHHDDPVEDVAAMALEFVEGELAAELAVGDVRRSDLYSVLELAAEAYLAALRDEAAEDYYLRRW